MLSGFETVGLLLAIAPIIQSSAEFRVSLLKPAFRQKTKDNKVAEYYQQLHNELVLLNQTLRKLLKDLPNLEDEQKTRLRQLQVEAWEEEAVAESLSTRLGNDYQAVWDNLKEILNALEDIISERSLNLDRTDLSASQSLFRKLEELRKQDRQGHDDLRTRFRFTSKQWKLSKSLKKITERHKLLERLLNGTGSPAPETLPLVEDIKKKDPAPKKIGELVQKLHNSFASLHNCSCPAKHEARLCMDIPRDNHPSGLPPRLDLFISIFKASPQEQWQESSVHIDIEVQQSIQNEDRQVRFGPPDTTQPTGQRQRRSSLTEAEMNPIPWICHLAGDAHRNDAFLEMMLKDGSLWHIKSSRRRKRVQEPHPDTTLLDVLSAKRNLSQKDRRKLALILATALLDLKGSPWLEDNWSKAHIRFMSPADDKIDYNKPYLTSHFKETQADARVTSDNLYQLHNSPSLLGLGIMLLELGISEPIETLRSEEDLVDGEVGANTDLTTAERVLEKYRDELQYGYREAVRACLDCDSVFPNGSFDFGDDEFRRQVYTCVVLPLERELEYGWPEEMRPKA